MDLSVRQKKSKKSKHASSETLNGPLVDTNASEALVPEQKHLKKRKRDPQLEGTAAVVSRSDTEAHPTESVEEVDTPGKNKKRQKKKEDKVLAGSAPVTQLADSGAVAPLNKKERREKKKRERERSGAIKAAAEAPSVHVAAMNSVASGSTPEEVSSYLASNSISIESPGAPVVPVLSFDQLAISSKLRQALEGFKQPTPIQACAWPALLAGHDVVGIAETGSGKTLAFSVPALAHITEKADKDSKGKGKPSILVVAPTRELALQTQETMERVGAPFGIKSVCVFGGVDKGPQKKSLSNKDSRIIVGTPGRLLDLTNEGACDLSRVSYLVLDEADRMLDKGFENDIRSIISRTMDGPNRQTLMFSATWPDSVRVLANTLLHSPVRITVGSDDLTANARVVQSVEVFDDPRTKDKRLHQLLRSLNHSTNHGSNEDSRILIFVLYKKEADRVLETLRYIGFTAAAIHGDMGQAARMASLEQFKTGKTGLLVATDVAARGLDIPNVSAVINYSFPLTIEDYIHRIGRTGRGGKSGKSFTFFTGDKHERALAGEFARVLREGGFNTDPLKKFPMTVKKKEHSAYGAFFRDNIDAGAKPTKIKF